MYVMLLVQSSFGWMGVHIENVCTANRASKVSSRRSLVSLPSIQTVNTKCMMTTRDATVRFIQVIKVSGAYWTNRTIRASHFFRIPA